MREEQALQLGRADMSIAGSSSPGDQQTDCPNKAQSPASPGVYHVQRAHGESHDVSMQACDKSEDVLPEQHAPCSDTSC